MPDQALRARVERILRGDVREDDLTRLFLFARDRCDGRESVQEIGDFVAHHDRRTKGIVTRTVRDWFAIARFRNWFPGEVLNPNRLSPSFPKFLEAMGRRLEHRTIKEFTGLTRSEAVAEIPSIISKLRRNADSTYALYAFYTRRELSIINCFTSHLVAAPAFTGARLFDEFAATLKSNGLINKDELRHFDTSKPSILLYAAIQMHNCEIIINDTQSIALSLTAHQDGNIQVDCAVPVSIDLWNAPAINLASAMFDTELKSSEYCEPPLLLTPAPWNFGLELSSVGLLRRLQ